jgi:hypothetical protein
MLGVKKGLSFRYEHFKAMEIEFISPFDMLGHEHVVIAGYGA